MVNIASAIAASPSTIAGRLSTSVASAPPIESRSSHGTTRSGPIRPARPVIGVTSNPTSHTP